MYDLDLAKIIPISTPSDYEPGAYRWRTLRHAAVPAVVRSTKESSQMEQEIHDTFDSIIFRPSL